jgi:hypothetical protein
VYGDCTIGVKCGYLYGCCLGPDLQFSTRIALVPSRRRCRCGAPTAALPLLQIPYEHHLTSPNVLVADGRLQETLLGCGVRQNECALESF